MDNGTLSEGLDRTGRGRSRDDTAVSGFPASAAMRKEKKRC